MKKLSYKHYLIIIMLLAITGLFFTPYKYRFEIIEALIISFLCSDGDLIILNSIWTKMKPKEKNPLL